MKKISIKIGKKDAKLRNGKNLKIMILIGLDHRWVLRILRILRLRSAGSLRLLVLWSLVLRSYVLRRIRVHGHGWVFQHIVAGVALLHIASKSNGAAHASSRHLTVHRGS